MSFSPAFLDEIRGRLPLSEVVGKHVRLIRAGREFKACCPFHNEKSPSFTINDDKQFYHCFGCGAHGDVIGFSMRYNRLSFPEAVESLAAQAGLSIPQNTSVERERFDHEKRLYQLLDRATAWFEEQLFAPVGREALGYLQRRSLSDEAIRRFRLGYAPADSQVLIRKLSSEGYKIEELVTVGLAKKAEDRNEVFSFFRNRVIFPVSDRKDRIVAFGARILGQGEPKYLNSPDHPLFHKGKLLYGLSRARSALAQNQPLIVVEGYMDVIALVEAGYTGAVAPLGTALTEDQITALWKLLPPVDARDPARDYSPILCFDGDNAGKQATERALKRILPILTMTQAIQIANMPEGTDPDDLIKKSGKEGMQRVLVQAKPIIDFIWISAYRRFERRLKTPEGQANFRTSLDQYINLITDENLRKLYQNSIVTKHREEKNRDWEVNQKQYKNKGGSNSHTFDLMLVRQSPPSPQRARERVLLALMINHPALFNDFGEDLAYISFTTPEFEALRQRVVTILSLDSQEPLDGAELYRHLSTEDGSEGNSGFGLQTLTEVLSETTYVHAGFARPGKSLDEARHGWKSIRSKHLLELIDVDLKNANRLFKENDSHENWARIVALVNQKESLMHESGDASVFETSFSTSQEIE